MVDIKGLFVRTPVSMIRVIQLVSTLKNNLFRNFQSLGSLAFYLVLVSISFVYTSRLIQCQTLREQWRAKFDKIYAFLLLISSQKKTSMKCTCKGHTYERPGCQMHSFPSFKACEHSSQITPYFLKMYFTGSVFL